MAVVVTLMVVDGVDLRPVGVRFPDEVVDLHSVSLGTLKSPGISKQLTSVFPKRRIRVL